MEGRERVIDCVMEIGLAGVQEVLEYARTLVCGEPYERDGNRDLARWGYKAGKAYVGGRTVSLERPRIRDVGKGREVDLPAWKRLQDPAEFDEAVYRRIVRGISCRDYEGALEETRHAMGVSRNQVDRAFIRKATARWKQMQERDLSKVKAWAVVIDGIHIGGEAVGICALAFTEDGQKEPLGFWEGSTESSENVGALLADLEKRGFRMDADTLFLIDGGSGLTKGLRNRFGKDVLIARCFLHKLRNLKKYLAPRYHAEARHRLYRIRDAVTEAQAMEEMRSMLVWLKGINVSAHRSLEEAGVHLTTLQRLSVPGLLRKHLYTTNAVESMFGAGPRKVSRNVKRWRNSPQRQRYLAAGLHWAWTHFRKLDGYKALRPWLAQRELAAKRETG